MYCGTVADLRFTMHRIWDTLGNYNVTYNIRKIFISIYILICFILSFRSYISFDILRRVLSDYFGYDILYVMNITDIDDKIIKRARQNYLYDKYVEENRTLDEILDDAKSVMSTFEHTVKTTDDPDKKCMLQKMLANVERAIVKLEDAVKLKDEKKIKEFQEVRRSLLFFAI